MTLERQHTNQPKDGERDRSLTADGPTAVQPVPHTERLTRLSEQDSLLMLLIAALTGRAGKVPGPRLHELLRRWLRTENRAEVAIIDWLGENGVSFRSWKRRMEAARRDVDRSVKAGVWCAQWKDTGPPSAHSIPCPQIVFGRGTLEAECSWIAPFNSRTSRLRKEGEEWLENLRRFLPQLVRAGFGVASSVGTLTYDLATQYAQNNRLPLLLWWPGSLDELESDDSCPPFSAWPRTVLKMTCRTKAMACDSGMRAVCRDRLLAHLADAHGILRIRPGGNLHSVLLHQQRSDPRRQWRMHSNFASSSEGGLSSNPPEIRLDPPRLPKAPPAAGHAGRTNVEGGKRSKPTILRMPDQVDWRRFLMHYTRACPGPWPDQTYDTYLSHLLEGSPLCRHTALDTLTRILLDGRIRASAKLLKGDEPAISFSSIPPNELTRLRQWNTSQARWTVEPYGLAIGRDLLKCAGARPALYGPEALYQKLGEGERFRFQRHEAPGCFWKHEHEWRLPRDLAMAEIPHDQLVVFVRTILDADRIAAHCGVSWAIVVLDEPDTDSTGRWMDLK